MKKYIYDIFLLLITCSLMLVSCEKPFWNNDPNVKMTVYGRTPHGQVAIQQGDTVFKAYDLIVDSRKSENIYRKHIKYLCIDKVCTHAPNLIDVDTLWFCTVGQHWIRLIGWNDDGDVDSTEIKFQVQ